MDIKDITSENYEQFKYVFWLDWSNKVKYIDLFKRGITSGETLGLFFIKDAKAVLELVNYYKDFKKIVIYDSDATISLLKDYDSINEFNDPRVEYIEIGQDLPMKFDKIIMNPPYSLGNKVTKTILSSLNDNGDCVCLMPLSQYKAKGLYRHISLFELANPSFFEDADITENLSICTLKASTTDKYSWMDLTLTSVDQKYIEYYKWNVKHNRNIKMRQIRDKEVLPENIDKHHDDWFIETIRCSAHGNHQGGFGKGGTWYKWNMENKTGISNAFAGVIDNLGHGLNNFRKWWYYLPVQCGLASKVIGGINKDNFVGSGYFAIPQIDWEHISDSPLWQAGNYDEAVLSEMGLKWQGDSIVEC